MARQDKIYFLDDLIKVVEELKQQGRTVVQSHGVYDIIHPGHIQHLTEAKAMGQVLVVTVIRDQDVRRGPGRPVFPEQLRAENVASLEQVDFVAIVDDDPPFACVKRLKPQIFAKGQAHQDRDREMHKKLFEEERELYFGKSKILETLGFPFSASQFINSFLDIYPEETKHFIRKFAQKYSFPDIKERLNALSRMKVLILGDGIIDEYHYCSPIGKSAKAQLVVNKYLMHEVFNGGVFAIANHVAGLVDQVTLVSLLGREESREDFITQNLKNNIRPRFFYREDAPTIVKKRYVDSYTNQKLFEINYLNDQNITGDLEAQVVDYLTEELPRYDLVLVSDFGHGLVTGRMIPVLERYARFLAVNTQTNAANTGFNLITKYQNLHFACLAETETRLTMQDRFGDIDTVADKLFHTLGVEALIVTLGKKGSVGLSKETGVHHTPIFSSKVVDTVGAGDAVFSYTAPCFAGGMPLDLTAFIGNAVGAIAVQIICNKKSVEKYELLEFINSLLKQGL
ncbi:MAG: PfkB family carbohydrate kinase [Thermodesulfobacteriota bacterium]